MPSNPVFDGFHKSAPHRRNQGCLEYGIYDISMAPIFTPIRTLIMCVLIDCVHMIDCRTNLIAVRMSHQDIHQRRLVVSSSEGSTTFANRHIQSDEGEKQISTSDCSTERSKKAEMDFVTVQEPFWLIAAQVFIPYIVAGIGMVGAGTVLNVVKVTLICVGE